MKQYKAILFDLDGTLLDTAPELVDATNNLLTKYQKPTLPYDFLRPHAGRGSKNLLKIAFNTDETDAHYIQLQDEFFKMYESGLGNNTDLFQGMSRVLRTLNEKNIPWGVVTNKPTYLTKPLLQMTGLDKYAACVVCGDTLPQKKPDPQPLLYACQQLGIKPSECLYIGDSKIDIEACIAAGMDNVAALYGYIPESEKPTSWNANAYISNPEELLEYI